MMDKEQSNNGDSIIYECDQCGTEVSVNDKICPKCGSDVSNTIADQNVINDFWHTTWIAWKSGILSELSPDFEKNASLTFFEFLTINPDVKNPAIETFFNKFIPQPMEFLIGYDCFKENKPSFILTNQRLMILKKEDRTYTSFDLVDIADFSITGVWAYTLTLIMHNSHEHVFHIAVYPKDKILRFLLKEAQKNNSWQNLKERLSANPIYDSNDISEEQQILKIKLQSEFSVYIPNKPLDLSESVSQLSPSMSGPLMRSAILKLTDNCIQLIVPHYYSDSVVIGELPMESIKCISIKGKVTRKSQLARGYINGAIYGILGIIFIWFIYPDKIKVSFAEFILISLSLVTFLSLVIGLLSRGDVSSSDLDIVFIEGKGEIKLPFCIEKSELESLLIWAKNKDYAIEGTQ